MSSRRTFGHLPDGRTVHLLTVGEEPGAVAEILTLGANVHRLHVTGGDGARRNIVLGHADVSERLASGDYVGGTIGRYANRIAGGRFRQGPQSVVVGTHDRGNSLHGGPDGFDRRVWEVLEHRQDQLLLSLVSPDGDQGFPGELTVWVRYRVSGNTVAIDMSATTDAPTVVNLTNHAYFNLGGEGNGTIDDHVLGLAAELFTPVDDTGIPIGGHLAVADTPFDFRTPVPLGAAIRREHQQLVDARGIDHNFVIDGTGRRVAATLELPSTRTRLEVVTDQPGLQVYTGNFLHGTRRSTSGGRYRQGDGVALEPQLFPDSPNHPEWPSARLSPGDTYRSVIEWRLGPTRS